MLYEALCYIVKDVSSGFIIFFFICRTRWSFVERVVQAEPIVRDVPDVRELQIVRVSSMLDLLKSTKCSRSSGKKRSSWVTTKFS